MSLSTPSSFINQLAASLRRAPAEGSKFGSQNAGRVPGVEMCLDVICLSAGEVLRIVEERVYKVRKVESQFPKQQRRGGGGG